MSCDRCGNATRPLTENNGEMLCDGCWKPELLSFLEANREAIKAQVIEILLQQMLLAANIPDGARVSYYPLED